MMQAEVENLSGMLRDARLAAGLTQAGLAKKAQVSRSSVARFESGNGADMGLAAVIRLFDACGKSFSAQVGCPSEQPSLPREGGRETWPESATRVETVLAAFARAAKNYEAGALEVACQRWLQFAQFADTEGLACFQRLCASKINLCIVYYLVLARLLHTARRYPKGTAVTQLLTWRAPAATVDRRIFQVPSSVREYLKNAILQAASQEEPHRFEGLSVEISTCGFVVDASNPTLLAEIDLARIARTTDGSIYCPDEPFLRHRKGPASCNAFVTFFFPENEGKPELGEMDLVPPDLFTRSFRDPSFLTDVNFGSFTTGALQFVSGFEPLLDLASQTFLRGQAELDDVIVYDVNSRLRQPEIRLYAYCIERELDVDFVGEENLRYDIVLEVYEKKVLRRQLHLARTTTPALAVGAVAALIWLPRPGAEIRYSTKRPTISRADKS